MVELTLAGLVGLSIYGTEWLSQVNSAGLRMSLLAVAIIIAACLLWYSLCRHVLRVSLMAALICLIAAIRTSSLLPPPNPPESAFAGQKVTVQGIIDKRPETTNTNIKITLRQVKQLDRGHQQIWPGKIIATLPLYNQVQYGDVVQLTGTVLNVQKVDQGYVNYLRYHQIYGQLQFASAHILSRHQGNIFTEWSINAQQVIEHSVFYLLPRDDASFLLGIVGGIPEAMSNGFSQALKTTSTTHIIVASGYNIGIILTLMLKLGPHLGRNRTIALSFLPIICYVIISGADPSIVRAGITAAIAAIAVVLGRQKDGLTILALTAIAMLLYNPLWLFDVSFELSFAATAGILLLQPLLNHRLQFFPLWLRESVSTTAAAQIGVLPIILGTFQMLSVVGLLVNILVLWLVPWIMAAGACLILTSLALPSLAQLLVFIIEPALIYIRTVIMTFANLPAASLKLQLSWLVVGLYIAGLVWLGLQRRKLYASLG